MPPESNNIEFPLLPFAPTHTEASQISASESDQQTNGGTKCHTELHGYDKKVEIEFKKDGVSLRVFDIFERNMVFIFFLGNWESHPADWGFRLNLECK